MMKLRQDFSDFTHQFMLLYSVFITYQDDLGRLFRIKKKETEIIIMFCLQFVQPVKY